MSYNFKDEKEVKEFLDNLSTEYRFGCLSEKNPESCHLYGEYLETIDKSYAKAAKFYRSNCDDYNFPRSCFRFANLAVIGRGITKDEELALKYFDKSCNAGTSEACLNGGLVCTKDVDTKLTENVGKFKKGMEFLQKACDMKIGFACHYLGGMYIQGAENVVERNMKTAFDYAVKGCEYGNLYACANVHRMYKIGDGVEKDLEKSDLYKKKALELQDEIKNARTIDFQQE